MNEKQALNEMLKFRLDRYFQWPVDWRDFPVYGSKIFDPLKIKKHFNWVKDISGIYAHNPPYTAQVNVVTIDPFGNPKIANLTCDTAGKLYQKTREKVNYSTCKDAWSYLVKWAGSEETQKLMMSYIASDMSMFTAAFSNAFEYMIEPPEILRDTVYSGNMKFPMTLDNFPKLKVNLAFPLSKNLPGEKLVRYVEVVK
ncbi:MAG: hypothetical protein HXS54_06205 [Theionarchaea archaeon]|nr:hypothetical protein [Theionarchaea archaeon]DBA34851.1 TPA_asm: hypothetical protein vir521_00057 [Caudoviricetes sp. vir521]